MDREHQPRVKKKDRTGVIISIALHVVVIGVVLYLVSKTELGQRILEHTIGTTRTKKTEDKPKPPPVQPRAAPLKSVAGTPPASSGPRRAADAPAAVGEAFFTEE